MKARTCNRTQANKRKRETIQAERERDASRTRTGPAGPQGKSQKNQKKKFKKIFQLKKKVVFVWGECDV